MGKKGDKFVKLPSWPIPYLEGGPRSIIVHQNKFLMLTFRTLYVWEKSEKGFAWSQRPWTKVRMKGFGIFKDHFVNYSNGGIYLMRTKLDGTRYWSPKRIFLTKHKISSMGFHDRFALLSYNETGPELEDQQNLRGKITVFDFSASIEQIFQNIVARLENDKSSDETFDAINRLRNIPRDELDMLFEKLKKHMAESPDIIETLFYGHPMHIQRRVLLCALKEELQDRGISSESTIDQEFSSVFSSAATSSSSSSEDTDQDFSADKMDEGSDSEELFYV